jgi:hypothetical protein
MKLALALLAPAALLAQTNSFTPRPEITPAERMRWVIERTVMPTNILGDAIGAGIGTGLDAPTELGTHWTGFQKRYVNGMTTGLVQDTIEAGLGAAWHEDPRYFRSAPGTSFKGRLGHAAKMTFYSYTNGGGTRLAYARFVAVPTANALSDTWRPDSERDFDHFAARVGLGFAGHLSGNLWQEFWPDVKKKAFRMKSGLFDGL